MMSRNDDWREEDEEIFEEDLKNEKELRTDLFEKKQRGDNQHQARDERIPGAFKLKRLTRTNISSSINWEDEEWEDDFSDIVDIWDIPSEEK